MVQWYKLITVSCMYIHTYNILQTYINMTYIHDIVSVKVEYTTISQNQLLTTVPVLSCNNFFGCKLNH